MEQAKLSCEVAVVGGSIAGCTAATLLARQGLDVVLIEQHSDPAAYKALCTHFIQASATPTIRRLGVEAAIEQAGGLRNTVDVWARWGWIRHTEHAAQDYGYSIRRMRLDPILKEKAASTPGVRFLPGHTAGGITKQGARVTGLTVTDQQGRQTEIEARLVVGADGRHSKVAELAGVRTRTRKNNRAGYFAYYSGLPVNDGVANLWFLEPVVTYTFPNDDGLVLLAAMFPKKDLAWFRKDMETNLLNLVAGCPGAPDLSGAKLESKVLGLVDLPNHFRRASSPGLALVGDAAMGSDPLFGVGCGWAFQSAEWLADSVEGHLSEPAELDKALERYRRTHRHNLMAHQFLMNDYSRVRPFNPAEKLMFSAATHDPSTARHVERFATRSISVREFLTPAALWRALRANIRRRPRGDVTYTDPTGGLAGWVKKTGTGRIAAPLRTGSVEVDGLHSPFVASGPTEGDEAVVFVHGNPGSSRDWAQLVSSAGTLGRAVAFDLPGFGRADKPEDFD
jgi:menaquinone-9 beta-reductase